MDEFIQAGEFKSKCLRIMDRVKKTKRRVIITKRNKPVAQLLPIDEKAAPAYGCMKGTVEILGDIVSPIDEVWDADC
jgi:prevent-host-death family protein